MDVDDLVRYFGNQKKASEAINCSEQAVSAWGTKGWIPTDFQFLYQSVTEGELRVGVPKEVFLERGLPVPRKRMMVQVGV